MRIDRVPFDLPRCLLCVFAYLQVADLDKTEISRDLVATDDFNNVTRNDVFRIDFNLFTITDDGGLLGKEVLELLHDGVGLELLVVAEDRRDDDDRSQDNTNVHLCIAKRMYELHNFCDIQTSRHVGLVDI